MQNLYNEAFYDKQSLDSFKSGQVVLAKLMELLTSPIKSVVDMGCGVGTWLAAADKLGVPNLVGTDGDYVPRDKLMISRDNFYPNNLSKPEDITLPQERFELAISLEVAEHLPTHAASAFVQRLCELSDLILFSAAIPFQGGHGHVNENWISYWCKLFAQFGYVPQDCLRPLLWNNPDVCWWYRQNLLVLVKAECIEQLFKQPIFTNLPMLDIVHPEQYLIAVHRPNSGIKTKLASDFSYWQTLQNGNESIPSEPGYGPEFSYVENKEKPIEDLASVKSNQKLIQNPVVFDALSPIKYEYRLQSGAALISVARERAPDFICIGAQKSATTWLDQALRNHADSVWMPPIKELNFFNSIHFSADSAFNGFWRRSSALNRLKQGLNNHPDIDESWFKLLTHLTQKAIDDTWYKRLFGWAPEQKIVGEITPEYALLPQMGVEHALNINPDLKVILIIRNPIDRAISHIKMILRNLPPLGETAILELANSESLLARGYFSRIMDTWLQQIPEHQFKTFIYEKLALDAAAFAKPIFEFLNLKVITDKLPTELVHASGNTLTPEMDAKLRCIFANSYAEEISTMKLRIPELETLWR